MNEYEIVLSTGEMVTLKTSLIMDRVVKDIMNQSTIYINERCLFTKHIVSIKELGYC